MHYVLTKIFAKVSRKQELQLGNILTSKNIVDFLDKLNYTEGNPIPSLTVRKDKNRCIPHIYWGIAIFVVVAKYSNLFLPFTFFLNISHFTFCYELIICSETTDVMKIIRNSFSFV